MPDRPDHVILRHSEEALLAHGDTAAGANWPNEADRRTRFDVMLGLLGPPGPAPVTLCDFGCGTGELLAHLRRRGMDHVRYVGVDRSPTALALAQAKFPDARFIELDIHAPGADLAPLSCDYLVANGVFTVRWEMSQAQMEAFLEDSVHRLWPWVRRGLAFNVMSPVVDWTREDLFHAPMDDVARLLHGLAGRRVLLRADYGLYEYTAYAWTADAGRAPGALIAGG